VIVQKAKGDSGADGGQHPTKAGISKSEEKFNLKKKGMEKKKSISEEHGRAVPEKSHSKVTNREVEDRRRHVGVSFRLFLNRTKLEGKKTLDLTKRGE